MNCNHVKHQVEMKAVFQVEMKAVLLFSVCKEIIMCQGSVRSCLPISEMKHTIIMLSS